MAVKKHRCTNCKKYFDAETMLVVTVGKFHDMDCLLDYGMQKTDDLVKKAKSHKKKVRAKERREYRNKDKSWQLSKAQEVFNKYIRIRDINDGCISCDKPANWGGQWHASHYRPVGNCSSLRFHPMNNNKACSECNGMRSGNLIGYRMGLVKKIGVDNVEWLESQNSPYKWDIEDVSETKAHYKNLITILESSYDIIPA